MKVAHPFTVTTYLQCVAQSTSRHVGNIVTYGVCGVSVGDQEIEIRHDPVRIYESVSAFIKAFPSEMIRLRPVLQMSCS